MKAGAGLTATSCTLCAHLHRAWKQAPASPEARAKYVAHLAAAHPGIVPLDALGCEKCGEFHRALNSSPVPTVREMLVRLSKEHRVDVHLIGDQTGLVGGT